MFYKIYAGLAGGFGGPSYLETAEFETEEQAIQHAYMLACEDYDGYAGLHGLRDIDQILEEEELDDESIAEEIYNEERENWIEYHVEEDDGETE